MSDAPILRVVPLFRIQEHEEIDPLRVERLIARIADDDIQVNPMVCVEAHGGELVLLDGATRTAALRGLGLEHAVVQIVLPHQVKLETWHHVVRNCQPDEVLERISDATGIAVTEVNAEPKVHLTNEKQFSVVGQRISDNATLGILVASYIGHWTVNRVIDPSIQSVGWRFADWTAIVQFPSLTVEDVMSAAIGKDLLPPGITRFLINDRALRVNVDLALLKADRSEEEKQDALDSLLEVRAGEGRIRRYEETVVILDD
jgi:hypothetical protein